MLDTRPPTRAGQALSALVITGGGAFFLWTAARWIGRPEAWGPGVAALFAMTVAAGLLSIRLPGAPSFLSLSDAFTFATVLLYGPEPAAVIAGVEGLVATYFRTRRWAPSATSLAVMCLSVDLSGRVYWALLGAEPGGAEPVDLLRMTPPLAAMAAAHYTLNSFLVALLIGVRRRRSIVRLWRESFSWAALGFLAGALVAGLAVALFRTLGPSALLICLPVLGLTYVNYRATLGRLERKNREIAAMNELHLRALEVLAMAIDARGQSSYGHPRRVQAYAVGLAELAGLDEEGIRAVSAGALLHDVGRLGIPDYILNKPGKLTPAEYLKVRTYPVIGAQIVEEVGFPYPVVPIVRHHREHWDGSGSPDGLAGEEIPLGARIVAIADAADAMMQPRPYHNALSREEALEELSRAAGRKFDPALVELFTAHADELLARAEEPAPPPAGMERIASIQRDYALSLYAETKAPSALEQIAAARREAMAMQEFTRDLGRSLGLDQTLERILERLRNLISFDCGVVYLVDGGNDTIRAAAAAGSGAEELRGNILMAGEGVSGWAVDNAKTLVNVVPMPDFRGRSAPLGSRFRSALVSPLVHEGRVIGAVTLYHGTERAFTSEDERILELVGPEAAAAIENARTYEKTRENAMTDSLTGLPNLRFLFAQLEKEAVRARRHHRPFGVAVFDLDRFKPINDRYGHRVGDAVLRAVSGFLQRQLRTGDTVCRWGGDEFVALLPDADPELIRSVVSRIQKGIEETPFECGAPEPVRIGVSAGWAGFPDDGDDFEELIRIADKRMYADKAARQSAAREVGAT
ncbi:MAG: diguanylate cyclase [Acidobacteria bacterium]|nr:MAG: diguanylate cyclase [Acidobacteriota bacterium]